MQRVAESDELLHVHCTAGEGLWSAHVTIGGPGTIETISVSTKA